MSRRSKAAEFLEEVYDIHVTGRNVQVTEPMKDYAIEKISKIERFSNRIIDVLVTMDIQKMEHRCDIVMKVGHILIKSHGVSDDMYVSIDMAIDKIRRQLLKYKDRIQDHQARGISMIEMNVNVLAPVEEDLLDVNEEIDSENRRLQQEKFKTPQVVSKEKRLLKTLTTPEAVMKIDLSGDHFLIFRSEEDQRLKVIYRRSDGNYGIIEAEG